MLSNGNYDAGKAYCHISDPELECSTQSGGAAGATIIVKYIGTDILTVTYFELSLYATTSGSLGTPVDYTLTVHLPQYSTTSAVRVVYGNDYTAYTTYCTCTSNFKIGNTAIGTAMKLETPVLLSNMQNVMTSYYFDFGSYSYRDTFFSTSYYEFNWGYLTQPSQYYRNTLSNFRCRIYEVSDEGAITLSSKWDSLDFNSFTSIKLKPKEEIDDPASYLFRFSCFGSAVANSSGNM